MYIKTGLFSLLLLAAMPLLAQQEAPQAATQLCHTIANRMKDSLGLTIAQRDSIVSINTRIMEQKAAVRLQYASERFMRNHLLKVEYQRDSLYMAVLPPGKYNLYLQKKSMMLYGK